MEDFSMPMDEEEISSDKGSNGRTILHFDIDCFYAQVLKNLVISQYRYNSCFNISIK